jgi:hypothetical protein
MTRNVARSLLLITLVAAGASSIANAQQPYRSSEARANGEYNIPYDSPNDEPHLVPTTTATAASRA